MNKWTELVTKTFEENKHKAGYKLKNAMKDAKKVWKTLKKRIFKGGKKELEVEEPAVGGKSRRKTAKNSRSRKSRK
uniref:Uncharacterized protein n=1 Tax=viral metagenome TaxID=1070528 RepID=A0A6C0KKU9_9ZZZZ